MAAPCSPADVPLGAFAHQPRERLEQLAAAARFGGACIEEVSGVSQGVSGGAVGAWLVRPVRLLRALSRFLVILNIGHGLNYRLGRRCARLQRMMRAGPAPVHCERRGETR